MKEQKPCEMCDFSEFEYKCIVTSNNGNGRYGIEHNVWLSELGHLDVKVVVSPPNSSVSHGHEMNMKINYCPNCGRALKWEERERNI